jgi:hypothetical protein
MSTEGSGDAAAKSPPRARQRYATSRDRGGCETLKELYFRTSACSKNFECP